MEEESSIDGLRLSQLEQESESDEVDIMLLGSMLLAARSRDREPPALAEVCGGSLTLKTTAVALHRLLSQKGTVKYTEENRKDLELVLRAFVYDVALAARNGEALFTSQELQKSRSELEKTQRELLQTSRILDARKREEEEIDWVDKGELVRENTELRDEVDQLHRESVAATQKYLMAKKQRESEFEELRTENEKLRESVQTLTDRIKAQEFHVARKEKEITRLMKEVGEKEEAIANIEQKLQAKKRRIEEVDRKRQKAELKLEEVVAESERSVALMSQRMRETSQTKRSSSASAQVQNLSQALRSLTTNYERQCSESIRLHEMNKNLVDVIAKYDKVFEAYEAALATKEDVHESNLEIAQDLKMSHRQVLELERQLDEYQDFVTQIEQLTNTETTEEAVDAVAHMLNNGFIENKRLRSIVDEEMRFISSLTSSPFISDKQELEVQIARCRQYIKENVFSGDQETEEEENPRDVETCLILQTKRAAMLIEHCEKLRREVKILDEIVSKFHYEQRDVSSLPHFLASRFNATEKLILDIQDLLKVKDEQAIIPEMRMRNNVLNDLDTRLREKLNFEGQLGDLAIYAVEYINNIEERALMDRTVVERDAQTEIEAVKAKFEEEAKNKDDQICQLEKELKTTQDLLKKASQDKEQCEVKLTEAAEESERQAKRASDQNIALVRLKESVKELEDEIQTCNEDNRRLKEQLAESCAVSRQKSEQIMAEERTLHQNEIDAIHSQFESVSQRMKQELARKTARNKELKAKVKEVIDAYTKAFQKQKQTIARLRRELEQSNQANLNSVIEDPEVEVLAMQVKQLTAENAQLRATQDTSDEKLKQVREVRDNYWKAQIAQMEQDFQDQSQQDKEVILELRRRLNETSSDLKKAPPPKVIQLDKAAVRRMEEWEKWARDLYSSVNPGDASHASASSLRFALGEMMLSSIAHRQLMERLKSLRLQKQLFLHGYTPGDHLLLPKQPTMRNLLILAMACVRIQKKKTGVAGSLSQYSTYV